MRRALVRAQAETHDALGPTEISFFWKIEPTAHVTLDTKNRVEETIRESIRSLVATVQAQAVKAALSGKPAFSLDLPPPPPGLEWLQPSGLDEIERAFGRALAARKRTPPTHGYLGLIVGQNNGFGILIYEYRGRRRTVAYQALITLGTTKFDAKTQTLVVSADTPQPVGSFFITDTGDRIHGAGDSNLAKFERFLFDSVGEDVRASAPVELKEAAFRATFHEHAKTQLKKFVATTGGRISFALLTTPSGKRIPLFLGPPVPGSTIELIPLAARDGDHFIEQPAGPSLDEQIDLGLVDDPDSYALRVSRGDPTGGLFPPGTSDEVVELGPFGGEPSLDELGVTGGVLRPMLEHVARRLEMRPIPYAARFCLNAAKKIGEVAKVASFFASNEPAGRTSTAENGNIGSIHLEPERSQAMAYFQQIAATIPLLTELRDAVERAYEPRAKTQEWKGDDVVDFEHWKSIFEARFLEAMATSIGGLFVCTCQAMMLQLVAASAKGIASRLADFPKYEHFFQQAVITKLIEEQEVRRLRDALDRATDLVKQGYRRRYGLFDPDDERYDTRLSLRDSMLRDQQRNMAWMRGDPSAREGELGKRAREGEPGQEDLTILDADGNEWTLADLDLRLQILDRVVQVTDPVVTHFQHQYTLRELNRMRAGEIRDALKKLLMEMRDSNRDTRNKALEDADWAFEKGHITDRKKGEAGGANYPGGRFTLQGIHLVAYEQLVSSFGVNRYVTYALDRLFSRRKGSEELKELGAFVGIALLAVLCPPLAEAAMLAQAVMSYRAAKTDEKLYQGLLSPEQIISWGELRVELFVSKLMLVVSVLPFASRILGAVKTEAKQLFAKSAEEIAEAELTEVFETMSEDMVEQLLKDFAAELGKNAVIGKVIETSITPLLEKIARDAELPEYEH